MQCVAISASGAFIVAALAVIPALLIYNFGYVRGYREMNSLAIHAVEKMAEIITNRARQG